MKEGQVRIPSGCAIAAVISKEGKRMSGELITEAMRPMHERSNGLGGGFAGYGIYPEYKDFYALHLFFDNRTTRKECEAYIKEYQRDGLHSYNNAYKTMKFTYDDKVFFIGKVIGVLDSGDIATDREIEKYLSAGAVH